MILLFSHSLFFTTVALNSVLIAALGVSQDDRISFIRKLNFLFHYEMVRSFFLYSTVEMIFWIRDSWMSGFS